MRYQDERFLRASEEQCDVDLGFLFFKIQFGPARIMRYIVARLAQKSLIFRFYKVQE